MEDLKERAIRGGAAKIVGQAVTFSLRIGSLVVLGRLLEPEDFGLVGMVTAIVGVLNVFRDFGLSAATVQHESVSEEQMSTLFWVNLAIGASLTVLALAAGPAMASFYHESRLLAVNAVLSTSFLINAAGVQHAAQLQRQMRFTTLATIEIVALVLSTAMGIAMAANGYGYWALVGSPLIQSLVLTFGVWLSTRWIPGRPRRNVEMGSMLRFGGTLTLSGLSVYIAYNLEKVLLGRFWGAEVLGIYGRAYQLINIPTSNLNEAAGGVAFAALSRVKNDPVRLKSYFLKGYSLVLALTLPATAVCALFADDLIFVVLGPKWKDVVDVFRLLAPTILIFALINPLSWLMLSLGLAGRNLRVGLILAPLVIGGYLVGLPHGPKGVALGFSTVLTLWVVPHIAWCVHGTVVSLTDIGRVLRRPLVSSLTAGAGAYALLFFFGQSWLAVFRLLFASAVFLSIYLGMLLYVMGQWEFYLGLLRRLKFSSPIKSAGEAST